MGENSKLFMRRKARTVNVERFCDNGTPTNICNNYPYQMRDLEFANNMAMEIVQCTTEDVLRNKYPNTCYRTCLNKGLLLFVYFNGTCFTFYMVLHSIDITFLFTSYIII